MAKASKNKAASPAELESPEVHILRTMSIANDPNNTRTRYHKESLHDLAQSIKTYGVIQPITVRPDADGWMVVCGHRRLEASRIAGLTEIPAIIRNLSDDEAMEIQVLENLQREDVSPIDEAKAFASLLKRGSIEEISVRIGKSKKYVSDRVRLNNLNALGQALVNNGILPIGHAILISKLEEKQQREVLNACTFGHDFENEAEDQDLDLDNIEVTDNYDAVQRLIHNTFRYFTRATFNTEDPDLHPEAGSCTVCPKRTKNQQLLFEEITAEDLCTDGACFRLKTKLGEQQRIAEAIAKYGNIPQAKAHPYDSGSVSFKGENCAFETSMKKGLIPVLIKEGNGHKLQAGDVVYIKEPAEKPKGKAAAAQAEKSRKQEIVSRDEAFVANEADLINRIYIYASRKWNDIQHDMLKTALRSALSRVSLEYLVAWAPIAGINTGIHPGSVKSTLNDMSWGDRQKLKADIIDELIMFKDAHFIALICISDVIADNMDGWEEDDIPEMIADMDENICIIRALKAIGFYTGEFKPLSEIQ